MSVEIFTFSLRLNSAGWKKYTNSYPCLFAPQKKNYKEYKKNKATHNKLKNKTVNEI